MDETEKMLFGVGYVAQREYHRWLEAGAPLIGIAASLQQSRKRKDRVE